ncbi:MAG: TolC family protein [Sedimenticolaceae bacterium]
MPRSFCQLLPRLALLGKVAVLGACTTLGPDYERPEVNWLDRWHSSVPGLAHTQADKQVDLQFWWQAFNDPVLNQLIEKAHQANPSLLIAGLRILESRALLGIAGSNLYPQVQQANGAVSYVNTQQRGGSLPDDSQSLASYQLGFNLSWELDFWGRFKRGVESADASFFASIEDQQEIQVLVSAQVADLYFAYRTIQSRIGIARKNAAIQKRSYEITEKIFKSGGDSELDLQQAKTQYLVTLSTIPQLQIELAKTRNALCAVLGRAPGDLPEMAGETNELPDIGSTALPDIPARLLLRRPDVRAAASQVAAQSAQIGIAESDFYPAIALLGNVAWSGTTLGASPDIGSLAIGPAVRWNLFDHGRISNNVRLQDARLQQLIESYQNTVLQAAREVDDAGVSVVKTVEQQALILQSVDAAQRALDIANTRYREGYADFQRVLDAQRALFSQAERQLINHGTYLSSVVSLYKGLGGGWQATPIDQLIPEEIRKQMEQRTDWGNLLTAPLPPGGVYPQQTSGASKHE